MSMSSTMPSVTLNYIQFILAYFIENSNKWENEHAKLLYVLYAICLYQECSCLLSKYHFEIVVTNFGHKFAINFVEQIGATRVGLDGSIAPPKITTAPDVDYALLSNAITHLRLVYSCINYIFHSSSNKYLSPQLACIYTVVLSKAL